MENLYKVVSLFCLFAFFGSHCFAQDKLVVFQYAGEPFYEENDSIKSIRKGTVLEPNCFLTLNEDDEIILVNSEGEPITLRRKGNFSYEDLCALKPKKVENSIAGNFFSYAWKELIGQVNKRNNKSGVVYRGDEVVLMRFPGDSIRIYLDEISFKWDSIPNKERGYFLHIKDLNTDKVFRKESVDNFITIKIEDSNLNYGTDYLWGISESKYESFDKLKTYSFRLLSKEEFDEYRKDLKKLVKDLKEMGLTEAQAKESICEYSKFCY